MSLTALSLGLKLSALGSLPASTEGELVKETIKNVKSEASKPDRRI